MSSYGEVSSWVRETYGERNRTLGVEPLLESIEAAASRLSKAYRKRIYGDGLATEVARIIARVIALGDLLELNVHEALRVKYAGYCRDCNHKACQCGHARAEDPPEPSLPDENAPMSAYQTMLQRIYGVPNAHFGVQGVLLHIFEEIAEVRRAVLRGDGDPAVELADVLAHTLGYASMLHIDVDAALERYQSGCPQCAHTVCNCPLDS